MIIADVKAVALHIPLEEKPPYSLSGAGIASGQQAAQHVLVEVSTDEGITGYGEVFTRLTPRSICTFIEEGLKPHIVGQNPTHIERLWNLMYRVTFRWGRKGLVLHCISGVELALWDIIGKYRGIPVYELLGGLYRDKVTAYASLLRYGSPEDTAAVARRFVDQGYPAVKLHQSHVNVLESVRAVRQAIGYEPELMIDLNGSWSPREAVIHLHELEQYKVLWVEEPVWPMDDYDGLRYVKDRSSISIAAGENEYTHYGFREMIAKQAVDIVQPDVTKAGGLSACRKILALAEAWNVQLVLHCSCFGPGVAATLHFCASAPSTHYIEIHPVSPKTSFIQPCLRPDRGYLIPPNKPGLGIEIDKAVVEEYSCVIR